MDKESALYKMLGDRENHGSQSKGSRVTVQCEGADEHTVTQGRQGITLSTTNME